MICCIAHYKRFYLSYWSNIVQCKLGIVNTISTNKNVHDICERLNKYIGIGEKCPEA